MTGIAPGAYVRVTRGMYAGNTGRTLAIHQSAEGPYATLDVGDTHNIGVLLTALELVGAVPTVEQERDAAIAERDEWKRRAEYAERELSDAFGLPAAIGPADGEAKRITDKGRAAIAERDRLRGLLEEHEADMHARIRAGYDAAIADCWRAAITKVEAERDRLRRELERLRDEVARCEGDKRPDYETWEWDLGRDRYDLLDRLDAILRGES